MSSHTETHTASSDMSIDGGFHNPISCASCVKPSEVWHTEGYRGESDPLSLACRSGMEEKKHFRSHPLSSTTISLISHKHWGV